MVILDRKKGEKQVFTNDEIMGLARVSDKYMSSRAGKGVKFRAVKDDYGIVFEQCRLYGINNKSLGSGSPLIPAYGCISSFNKILSVMHYYFFA